MIFHAIGGLRQAAGEDENDVGAVDASKLGYELGLLPAVGLRGADAQLPSGDLGTAVFAGQAQGLGLECLVVFTPFVGRLPAHLNCHHRRSIRPSAVRLA